MTSRIFAYVRHNNGIPDDTAVELAAAAKKIDPSLPLTAVITGFGPALDKTSEALRTLFQEVWKVGHPALQCITPESAHEALTHVLPKDCIVLLSHDHFGMDVGPGLSVKLNSAYVSDVIAVENMDRGILRIVRQEFGGQVSTHVACDTSSGAVVTIRPGSFKAADRVPLAGAIVDCSIPVLEIKKQRTYLATVQVPAGDVDITRYDILVSVGRGIQKQENLPLAEQLVESIGAALSCSRPVVDAKWLDKSRQVGTSGKTVKPKVYLACGISGQFQHLAGLKGNPLIIAINKNPKAPIFQVADVGVVADLMEFLPQLTEKVREQHAAAAHAGGER